MKEFNEHKYDVPEIRKSPYNIRAVSRAHEMSLDFLKKRMETLSNSLLGGTNPERIRDIEIEIAHLKSTLHITHSIFTRDLSMVRKQYEKDREYFEDYLYLMYRHERKIVLKGIGSCSFVGAKFVIELEETGMTYLQEKDVVSFDTLDEAVKQLSLIKFWCY